MKRLWTIAMLMAVVPILTFAASPQPGNVGAGTAYFVIDEFPQPGEPFSMLLGKVAQNQYGGGIGLDQLYWVTNCKWRNNVTKELENLTLEYVTNWGLSGKAKECPDPTLEIRDNHPWMKDGGGCCEVYRAIGAKVRTYNLMQGDNYWFQYTGAYPQHNRRPIR